MAAAATAWRVATSLHAAVLATPRRLATTMAFGGGQVAGRQVWTGIDIAATILYLRLPSSR